MQNRYAKVKWVSHAITNNVRANELAGAIILKSPILKPQSREMN